MSAESSLHLPSVTDARGRPLDVIELRGLTVDCIVGIYNREREAPQPLRLDVALFLDTRSAATGGRLSNTVHYGRLGGELRFLLEACRFELLESAAEALSRYLLAPPTADAPHARVHAVTVRITKPLALGGLAIPSIQMHRFADEVAFTVEERPFGQAEVIHEGAGYGIHRLYLKPGATFASEARPGREESELVLGSELRLQGHAVGRGMASHWPSGFARHYDNPAALEQTLLSVERSHLEARERLTREPATGIPYYPHEEPVVPTSHAERQP